MLEDCVATDPKNPALSILRVRVVPGASKSTWDGLYNNDCVKVRLQAPAVEGAANRALINLTAESFSLRSSGVELIRGEKSRQKDLRLALPRNAVLARLAALLPSNRAS